MGPLPQPQLSHPLDAIQEVAIEALKREDLPQGAREAFELVFSISRQYLDVRGQDWKDAVSQHS